VRSILEAPKHHGCRDLDCKEMKLARVLAYNTIAIDPSKSGISKAF
jgi:hypothetical protein